jgi:hypothetical protein
MFIFLLVEPADLHHVAAFRRHSQRGGNAQQRECKKSDCGCRSAHASSAGKMLETRL